MDAPSFRRRISATCSSVEASSSSSRVSMMDMSSSGSVTPSASPIATPERVSCEGAKEVSSRSFLPPSPAQSHPIPCPNQLTKYSPLLRSPSKILNASFTLPLQLFAQVSFSPCDAYRSGCTFCWYFLYAFFSAV